MKMWLLAGAAGLMLAGTGHAVQDATLKVGDKAPAFDQVTWLKGEPVHEFEAGHVYVIDFWATWCGPCVESIPHLNRLAKSHGDVTFIGAAVWPKPTMEPTTDFVERKGDGISYRVAEDIEGHIAKLWMQAAGRHAIPTAMIIDQQGTIAWIGHPMAGLDYVLESIAKDGRYDEKGLQEYCDAQSKAVIARLTREADLKQQLATARKGKDWVACADLEHQIWMLDSDNNGQHAVWAYTYHVLSGDKVAAARYGNQLATETFKAESNDLNALAWAIVDPGWTAPIGERDLDLALLAAQRADELTRNRDSSILDTLARVQFLRGNVDEAVSLQGQAIEQARSHKLKAELQLRLAEYIGAQPHG